MGYALASALLELLVRDGVISKSAALGVCVRLSNELGKDRRSGLQGMGLFIDQLAKTIDRIDVADAAGDHDGAGGG
jgi:hypothetical protein